VDKICINIGEHKFTVVKLKGRKGGRKKRKKKEKA
jgi:hypothetical protein